MCGIAQTVGAVVVAVMEVMTVVAVATIGKLYIY